MPPGPVQLSVKVDTEEIGPVPAVPLVGLLPLHAPLAVQLVALVVLHVSVDEAPLATTTGEAEIVTTGAGALMATVTDSLVLPPVPVQVSV